MSKISLADLAEGAVEERFNQELSRVLANIADPNTDPKKARKVTVTVTLKADENRDIVSTTIDAKSTVAPAIAISTKFVLGQDSKGRVVGQELKSGAKGQTFITQEGNVADDTGKIIDLKQLKEVK